MHAPQATRRWSAIRTIAPLMAVTLLAGCLQFGAANAPRLDDTGLARGRAGFVVTPENMDAIRTRMLEDLNARRIAAGQPPVQLSASLSSAAQTHSRSMQEQRRAWPFGADGSSPLDRARRAGFTGTLIGEVMSETYESDTRTLTEWLRQPEQRALLLDPAARALGLGLAQDPDMKLWWTLSIGY